MYKAQTNHCPINSILKCRVGAFNNQNYENVGEKALQLASRTIKI
jgi:hypothetical protein